MAKVFQKVASFLGFAPAAVPALPPPEKKKTTMPLADDEAIMAARRREIAAMQARSGRASTILSSDDKLGG